MALGKKKREKRAKTPVDELNLTPMIDVVFQLLVYFVVTFEPQKVYTHLDVSRPAPDDQKEVAEVPPDILQITVYRNGYTINDRQIGYDVLEERLFRLAGISKNATVMIMVTESSLHEQFVSVLNLCAKAGLQNISYVDTN